MVIPDSVTTIGSSAFGGCSSLENITIPFVGAKAGVTATDTYQYPFGYIFGMDSYTGGTATEQKYYGLSTSSTTSTTYYIPTSLKSVAVTGGDILYGAFYGCSGLTSVIIGNDVTTIGDSAFRDCDSVTSVVIGDSVTSIGKYAFAYCSSLTSVEIPDSVTSIGTNAFYYCTNIESVVIGGGVTTISDGAFRNCSVLKRVVIGDGVTSIGQNAFRGCGKLVSINILPKEPATIDSSTFYNLSTNAKLYCYSNAIKKYKEATNWNVYGAQFVAEDLGLHLIMNAKASKEFFVSKDKITSIISGSSSFEDFKFRLEKLL